MEYSFYIKYFKRVYIFHLYNLVQEYPSKIVGFPDDQQLHSLRFTSKTSILIH